ncbi:hypothetical protein MYX07_02580 [Patescibacteria group bacterium AH-259-L07]|nr:hypothetical protein [Patescibacteria group bacterium AH-259-L07]
MMKQIIALAGIFVILLALSPSQKDAMSDIYYNPATAPFTDILNWEDAKQRQTYDTILRAKYDILEYEIRYMDSSNTEISNPAYEKEKIQIIYDPASDRILGYIWTMEVVTLPILTHKPKPGFFEDPLVYAQLHMYESIYIFNADKHISLASFETLSLDDWKRIVVENVGRPAKRYRGLVNKKVYREYFFAPSTLKMINHAENNLSKALNAWKTQNPNKIIWIYLTKKREQEYREIARMIKQDVKEYGGKKWKKIWKDMQKIWPALKNI